jgi:cholesterol transport system auxiliary component
MSGARRAALCAFAVLLAGCAALRSPPPVNTYRVHYDPPAPAGAPAPVTVWVVPFTVAPPYDNAAFIYRTGPYDVGIDPYNRWAASPASMITELIARDLAASQTVQAVLQAPSTAPYDYELSGHIEALEERDDPGGCSAHVRARITLVRVPARRARKVVLQDVFSADVPCTRGDSRSFVEAMSRAVQQLSDAIRAAVLNAIASDSQ